MPLDLIGHPGLDPAVAPACWSLEFGRMRLKQYLQNLTPQELAAQAPGLANSIATLVVHVSASEVSIGHRLVGRPVPDELKAELLLDRPQSPLPVPEGETVASLEARLDQSRAILLGCLEELSAADLEREVSMGGGRTATVRWVLGLLPYHQSLHTGQIQMVKKLLPRT